MAHLWLMCPWPKPKWVHFKMWRELHRRNEEAFKKYPKGTMMICGVHYTSDYVERRIELEL